MSQLPEPVSGPATVSSGGAVPEPAESSPAAPGLLPEFPAPPPTPDPEDRDGREARPSLTRLIVGVVVGAAVATLGGFILGEYPFTGVTPYIAGLLFALVVAEVILSISRRHDRRTAVAAAVCTLGGLGLAVWISTGDGIDPIPIGGWMALAVGLVASLVRGGIKGAGRQGRSSLPS